MNEKPKIIHPIIVEGKYDKAALAGVFDATVVTLGGFEIFNSKEKQALIRTLSVDGIIVLTDSDSAGKVIRSFLSGIVPKDKIYNLYIPQIKGKEKRKTSASKEGLLGVEGMDRETLMKVLEPFIVTDDNERIKHRISNKKITKVDFYTDKLTGFTNSAHRRDVLCRHFGLPCGMTPNALLDALNILVDRAGYRETVESLFPSERPQE